MPCCADYAAAIDPSPAAGVARSDDVSARAVAPVPPVHAAPAEPRSGALYRPVSYVLLGLLVICVGALGVALTIQMRNAAEAARELAETRRLSEEMIALMKEARREAAGPAVPITADVPTGESVAPPQAAAAVAPLPVAPAVDSPPVALAVAPPPVEPAAPSTMASAVTASSSVASTSLAFFGTGTSLGQLPYSASAAPAPSTGVTADLAPSLPAASKPLKASRTVNAVKEKPANSNASSAEPATAFQDLASLPPAVRVPALPPRPPIARGWMKIERGLSRKEVRRLLGEPRSTEQLMTTEFWYYAERSIFGRGWVAFSDGTVIEWLTP